MGRNISKQQLFSTVSEPRIERSQFDRSHGWKGTINFGDLVPFYADDLVPGDTFRLKSNVLVRFLSPLKTPIMDNMWIDTHFFFVPTRLIWTNFVKMMGQQDTPGDSITYSAPVCASPVTTGIANLTLQDYLGIPTKVATSFNFVNLRCRAYNLIWREWFRSEDLQNPPVVDLGDGPDTLSNYVLLQRGKRHDLFTSCLPWTQKFTAPTFSISGNAAVTSTASAPGFDTTPGGTGNKNLIASAGAASFSGSLTSNPVYWGSNTGLQVASTAFTGVSINDLRLAVATQQLMERDARGGTRYQELIMAHFGVTPEDFRLQRPEFLGSSSQRIGVNQVAQTSATGLSGGSTSQGNLTAFSIGNGSCGFTYTAREHGHIIGLVSARADLNYQQGLAKEYSNRTRYDFYWPELAHIGEQPVYNREIYCDGTANDANVFGYNEPYAFMRYKPSLVTGQLRSNDAATLDIWHLAQNFGSLPTLGNTFIKENPPISRVVAVTTVPALVIDAWHQLICARPMPVHGDPGLTRL